MIRGAARPDPDQAHAGHAVVAPPRLRSIATDWFGNDATSRQLLETRAATAPSCYDGKSVPDAQYGFHVDNPYLQHGCAQDYLATQNRFGRGSPSCAVSIPEDKHGRAGRWQDGSDALFHRSVIMGAVCFLARSHPAVVAGG